MYLTQLNPGDGASLACTFSRVVARTLRRRPQRATPSRQSLKCLSRKRLGLVRFTPNAEDEKALALARHVARALARRRQRPTSSASALKSLSERRLGVVRFTPKR